MLDAIPSPLRTPLKSIWRRIPERFRRKLRTPKPHGEAPASWYDDFYEASPAAYAAHYTESHYYFLWTVIADRLRDANGVLEVGCGAGQLARLLHDQGLVRYVGFDFSAKAVELARGHAPMLDFRVEDARSSALFGDPAYDTVLCTEVLEHIDDDLGVLESIPLGRRVVATVPNFDSKTHVRFFRDAAEVEARYRPLFSSLVTTTHLRSRQTKFFLLDGVR